MIDTHCHLDDRRYFDDIDEVIARAESSGVSRILIPGASGEDLARAQELSERFSNIYFAAGIHPCHAETYDQAPLREALKHPRCIAVGECGLDYYHLPNDEDRESIKKLQKDVFLRQIALAREFDKPLIIHIREASNDSFAILKSEASDLRGVLHCYNADEILLGLSDNFYYGIGGVLTFSNARRLVEILHRIPLERLLLETDAPYLTPHPHRGTRNEPSYIPLIAKKISELLRVEESRIKSLTDENAIRLFCELAQ